MNKCWMLALGALAVLAGCESESAGTGGTGGVAGTGGSARACATDIAVGEVQAFGMPTPASTEGITFDADGNLFVSAQDSGANEADELLDVSLAGSFQPVAEAPSILGLESHSSGILGAGIRTANLLLIDPATGDVEVVAEDLGEPNFVVTTPWDTILVSDDRTEEGAIHEVTWSGEVSTWVQGVPSPNGMVFSLDNTTLYVATTFENPPGLWRVPVSAEGVAGTPEKWVTFDSGTTPDGVAIDSEGNIYVALNFVDKIAKVEDPTGDVTILAEGVSKAASLAFGQGEFDPCSLYVTNLFGEQLWRVGAGVPGTEK